MKIYNALFLKNAVYSGSIELEEILFQVSAKLNTAGGKSCE